tara:strand:+ start:228 stop:1169 length:942 start_codon:yes stop_codon:yes gene_type:complete
MFHRILANDGRPRVHTKALEVEPRSLEDFITFFKQRKYDFIRMDEVLDYIKKPRSSKFVVFTFDDGFEDNYTQALPLFESFGIPFTIYITTDMPDGKRILWNYILEDIILENEQIELGHKNWSLKSSIIEQSEKENVYNDIRRYLIDRPREERLQLLRDWFKLSDEDLFSKVKEHAMSWDQLKEISKNPLVEIGAHTITHPSLKSLNEREFQEEVIGSRQKLEEKLKIKIRHFAYPYGSVNEVGKRELELMKSMGFETAVTTRNGNVFKGHKSHLLALPRMFVGPNTKIEDIHDQVIGKRNFISSSKSRIVTV